MATGVPASTSAVPGPRSLAAMRRYVLNYTSTKADNDNLAVVDDAINAAIDRLNTRRWKKIIRQQDITLTAGTSEYALPDDFKEPLGLWRLNSDDERVGRLGYKSFRSLLAEGDWDETEGDPCFYTTDYDQRVLKLDKQPSSSFVSSYPELRLRYHRRQPHLSIPSDVLDGPSEFSMFVMKQARAEWAAIRNVPAKLNAAVAAAEQAWRELVINDNEIMTDWEAA